MGDEEQFLVFNVCPVHGVLEPSEIHIGGETGGVPICNRDENCQQPLTRGENNGESGQQG